MKSNKVHPEEKRARKYDAEAARRARRGDVRGAENAARFGDAIRRAAGLPTAFEQAQARSRRLHGRAPGDP